MGQSESILKVLRCKMYKFSESAVIAKTVINGLVAVLEEQGIDVDAMQFSLKSHNGEQTPELNFKELIDYSSDWLEQVGSEEFLIVRRDAVKGYFSNDGESYEVHNTIEEAKKEAECAIEYFSERLADQNLDPECDGNFHQVGYGVILAESGYTVEHVVTQADVDKGNTSYKVGTEILSLHLDSCSIDGQGSQGSE